MSFITHGQWKFDNSNQNKYAFKINSEVADTCSMLFDASIYSNDTNSSKFRKAAIIHRLARAHAKKLLVNGEKYIDVVKSIENIIHKLSGSIGEYNNNIAFPIGLSVNEIAAHDTAMEEDTRVLKNGDIVKCDIGVHVDGNIIDSAFTHIVGETDDTLKSHEK